MGKFRKLMQVLPAHAGPIRFALPAGVSDAGLGWMAAERRAIDGRTDKEKLCVPLTAVKLAMGFVAFVLSPLYAHRFAMSNCLEMQKYRQSAQTKDENRKNPEKTPQKERVKNPGRKRIFLVKMLAVRMKL